MQPNVLEINVNDTIEIFDTVVKAMEYLEKIVQEWFASDSAEPLVITFTKSPGRAPPVLEINVSDGIAAKGGLV